MPTEDINEVRQLCDIVYAQVKRREGQYAVDIVDALKDRLPERVIMNTIWRLADWNWIEQDEFGTWVPLLGD